MLLIFYRSDLHKKRKFAVQSCKSTAISPTFLTLSRLTPHFYRTILHDSFQLRTFAVFLLKSTIRTEIVRNSCKNRALIICCYSDE